MTIGNISATTPNSPVFTIKFELNTASWCDRESLADREVQAECLAHAENQAVL